jgi:hypothetical protein
VTIGGSTSGLKHRAMSILIHSDTKVGKSTFGNTAPAPRLLLDAEMAYRFLDGEKVFWDPNTEAPPQLGRGRRRPQLDAPVEEVDWVTCVVVLRDYSTFERAYQWLNSGQHHFISVIIDSISELQTKCKDEIAPDGAMKIQMWGDLLTAMERRCRAFRDLTEHPTHPLESVIITAMTQMREGKWRPYLQGQLQVKAPYYFDVIGYLYVDNMPDPMDPSKPPKKVRRMLTVPHTQFEAGERVQGRLPEVLDNPTVPAMLDMVFGPQNAPVAQNGVAQ